MHEDKYVHKICIQMKFSKIRKQYIQTLIKEVLGPDPSHLPELNQPNGQEILINLSPLSRYGAGILYPRLPQESSNTSKNLNDNLNIIDEENINNHEDEPFTEQPDDGDMEDKRSKILLMMKIMAQMMN